MAHADKEGKDASMRAHNGEGMTNGFRALALLLLLGVAGLVVTIALTDAVNPRASINVETGRKRRKRSSNMCVVTSASSRATVRSTTI
jgi:hypothetical protein